MIWRVLSVALLCLLTAGFLERTDRAERVPVKAPLAQLPFALSAWHGRDDPPMAKPVLDVLGVDEYVMRTYRTADGHLAGLYVGYYASQRQGDTMHSPLNCLPGAGWTPMQQGHVVLTVPSSRGPRSIEVNRVLIQKGLDRSLVLYWYQSHGRVVASEYWGKVYTVLDAIRENRTDAALVRIVVPAADGGGASASDAELRARMFAEALFPALETRLPS